MDDTRARTVDVLGRENLNRSWPSADWGTGVATPADRGRDGDSPGDGEPASEGSRDRVALAEPLGPRRSRSGQRGVDRLFGRKGGKSGQHDHSAGVGLTSSMEFRGQRSTVAWLRDHLILRASRTTWRDRPGLRRGGPACGPRGCVDQGGRSGAQRDEGGCPAAPTSRSGETSGAVAGWFGLVMPSGGKIHDSPDQRGERDSRGSRSVHRGAPFEAGR